MTTTFEPMPAWEARYRVPVHTFPRWNPASPDRIVVASTIDGSYQAHTWDPATGALHRLSSDRVGVTDAITTPDGEWVAWHQDVSGSESGHWVTVPFGGGASAPEPLFPGLPKGWNDGIVLRRDRSVIGVSDAQGFAIWVVEGRGEPRLLSRHRELVQLGGSSVLTAGGEATLSADDRLLVIEHAEHGDVMHTALRVIDVVSGETVADLQDVGQELVAFVWSPVPGDDRLAIGTERTGERAPAIWHVRTGEVQMLDTGLDGYVEAADWWPDGSALLLVQLVQGRDRLIRYEVASGAVEVLDTAPGAIHGARVRPDGAVWYRHQSGEVPARLLQVGRAEPLLAPPPGPAGRPFQDWSFPNPHGDRVHGFYILPEGSAPHPVLMHVHGGPTSVDLDRWSPEMQALVDAGFLVAMVNYRGSMAFGREWRDFLIGNIGWPEIEDINAGLDDLVARGLADPSRAVIAGWSWGGYLTNLMHGMHPDRYIAGVAGVPVGDYADGYDELSPMLQAYDRALLGGTPAEVPELMRERSPISYVDHVKAPILSLIGRNDSRCPYRQAMRFVDRLTANGVPTETYIYDTGHASFDIDERVRQRAVVLDFLARYVPGIKRLEGVDRWVSGALAAAASGR
jgi:dipeptidyl aminopeptidase/acylaminoacyl peptidase